MRLLLHVDYICLLYTSTDDGYTLSKITKDGKKVQDNDTFTVICLAIPKHMKAYQMCIRDRFRGYYKEDGCYYG